MAPNEYKSQELDGRQKENVLQKWFTEVGTDNPRNGDLWRGLTAFSAGHEKSPSQLARINVFRSEVDVPADVHQDALCNLFSEVAKGLDIDRTKSLRRMLKSLA